MPRPILIAAAFAILAGCMAEPPPRPGFPPPQMQPPPEARATGKPQAIAEAAAPHRADVKPLGRGTLTASAAGGYMDTQEKELRADLHGRGVTVSRMGDSLVLNLRADAVFGVKGATVNDGGRGVLERISDSVRKFDSTQVVVNAFTDTTGTEAQNLKLSQERADAVAKSLAEDGVDPHRVAAKGFGEEILKIPTGANVSEPRNRRIEIRITPRLKT